MLASHDDAVGGLNQRRENAINERREEEHAVESAREQEAMMTAMVATAATVGAANSRHHVRVIVIQAP